MYLQAVAWSDTCIGPCVNGPCYLASNNTTGICIVLNLHSLALDSSQLQSIITRTSTVLPMIINLILLIFFDITVVFVVSVGSRGHGFNFRGTKNWVWYDSFCEGCQIFPQPPIRGKNVKPHLVTYTIQGHRKRCKGF